MSKKIKKKLSLMQSNELLKILNARFEKNMNRHKGIDWTKIQIKLEADSEKLWSLNEMEISGGEPDVVGFDKKTGEYIFYDCSAESPKNRRSLCYDRNAWESRKEHKPKNNAMDMAKEMGIEFGEKMAQLKDDAAEKLSDIKDVASDKLDNLKDKFNAEDQVDSDQKPA